MANNHYVSKPKRRPRNKNRRDYTRETALKLRTPEQQQDAALRSQQLEKLRED